MDRKVAREREKLETNGRREAREREKLETNGSKSTLYDFCYFQYKKHV